MKRFLCAVLLLLCGSAAFAQQLPTPGGGSQLPNGPAGGVIVGAPISGTCPTGQVIYSNGGVVGCKAGGGSGTVTSVSVTTANGVSGSVATSTTTPAISLTLGAITPSSAAIGAGSAITSSGAGGALASGAYTAVGTVATQNANAVAVTGGTLAGLTGLAIRDTSATFDVTLAASSTGSLTANRALTFNMGNVAHILSFGATANTGSGIVFPNTATDTVAMLGTSNIFTVPQTIKSSSVNLVLNDAAGDARFDMQNNGTIRFRFEQSGTDTYMTADTNMILRTNQSGSPVIFMKADSSGAVSMPALINTATTSAVCYNTGTGVLTYDGTIGTCTISDERLKNMGGRIPNALERLLQINGVYYTWKDPSMGSGRQIGVGAQTVEKVFPELVQTDSNGRKSADYQRLTAPIIEALRELKADNDNLRRRLLRVEHSRR